MKPIALKYPAASGGIVCLSKEGVWGGAKIGLTEFPFSVRDGSMKEVEVVTITSE